MNKEVPTWVKNLFDKKEEELEIPLPQITAASSSPDQEMLDYANSEISMSLTNIENAPKEFVNEESNRAAENFLIMGNFDMAFKYAKSKELQKRITKFQKALETPDNEFCDCEEDRLTESRKNIPISKYRIIGRILNTKTSRMQSVIECVKCGHSNMTSEKTETQLQIERAMSEVGSNKSDSEIL